MNSIHTGETSVRHKNISCTPSNILFRSKYPNQLIRQITVNTSSAVLSLNRHFPVAFSNASDLLSLSCAEWVLLFNSPPSSKDKTWSFVAQQHDWQACVSSRRVIGGVSSQHCWAAHVRSAYGVQGYRMLLFGIGGPTGWVTGEITVFILSTVDCFCSHKLSNCA